MTLVHTRFSFRTTLVLTIVATSMLFVSCSKDEEYSDTEVNLPGVINFRGVGVANFSTSSSRATILPLIVDTVKITDNLYAEVSVTESSEEIATRADATTMKLPKNTQFRLLALDNTDIKANIVYKIKDENGKAEIVSGSGEAYKIGENGKKYFQLTPGKIYKMVGFSDGTSNNPGSLTDPLIYTWKSNFMKFATTLNVADGINQFGPIFEHMNAAIQVVINTSKTGNNVTSASAVMWQESNMPIDTKWSYMDDGYGNSPTATSGSETNSALFVWTNPNDQNVASDLQYFTPGTYGSLNLKFKNITVGGVNYDNIQPISLDANKMATLQRNKKYIITVSFIPPFNVTIADNILTGAVNLPRLVTVTATGALPPYSYEWTIECNGETTTFTNKQNTYQHSLNGDYKRMDYTVKCIVRDNSGKQVGVSLKSVLKQVVRKTEAEVPVSEVPWMQNWNSSTADAEIAAGGASANCIRYVRDQRDNTIYRIKKMADGRWWMMQGMAWEGLTPMGLMDIGKVSDVHNPYSAKVLSNLQGDIMYRNDMINANLVCPAGWHTPTWNTEYPKLLSVIGKANYPINPSDNRDWECTSSPNCLSMNNEIGDLNVYVSSFGATEYYYFQAWQNNWEVITHNRWAHNKFTIRCIKN